MPPIKQLVGGQQQDDGRQDPHDAPHGKADAFQVAEGDADQYGELDSHDPVAEVDQRPAAVAAVFVEVKDDAAPEIIQDQGEKNQV